MPHGLNPDTELVMKWRWQPQPPLFLSAALPFNKVWDDARFRAVSLELGLMESFRFNFSTLSRQSPDLHLYRLLQLFNTPLLTLTTRDAGRSSFAYWNGKAPAMKEGHEYAHFWFFKDGHDDDDVVLEYGFDQSFFLRSSRKSGAQMQRYYAEICQRVNYT